MRTQTTLYALLALGLLGACNDPTDRGTPAANVTYDERREPGNDDAIEGRPLDDLEEVGSIQSYAQDIGDGDPVEYDNIFRRGAEDAGFDFLTEDDADLPHVEPAGRPADLPPKGSVDLERAHGAEHIERYAPQNTLADRGVEDRDGGVEDRAREYLRYGSNRASEPGNTRFGETERVRGGQQAKIGAVGYDNERLEGYYDTDEEDFWARDYGDDEGTGNSWVRPLRDDQDEDWPDNIVRIGRTGEAKNYNEKYAELQQRLYDIPENQQALAYQPNTYSYSFLTSWDGRPVSTRSRGNAGDEASGDRAGNEVAYDRPPLMGSGCEQADDPITCSSAQLDGSLRRFLNDPRVLRGMLRSGITGVTFDVDEEGAVIPRSVRAELADRSLCYTEDCTIMTRNLARILAAESWTPAQRRGVATVSRIRLPLKARQTEELAELYD